MLRTLGLEEAASPDSEKEAEAEAEQEGGKHRDGRVRWVVGLLEQYEATLALFRRAGAFGE